ncbi:VCBS repeat-containing protein [Arenibacter sp. 6A1]|uniref:VCBS repeat-containing protein n=1 Tax=Arenibacter sp. 6A1 TaxID=2720391 RepID=UPI0014470DE1|nr:VCBS repeat-containing protein [Arenibacter sp. 6A1]NKI27533.1 VCBS repeat-containing protein [Arenibacter sp. 6A1]
MMKTYESTFCFWLYTVTTILLLPIIATAQKQEQFTLLEPGKTGVTFENTIRDTKASNILIYSNFYGGAGVGVGDFNNDGLQDIFFAGNLVSDQLYINKGEIQFEDITRASGIEDNGGWSSGVIIGDINNDGWQDIYVTRELYDGNPEIRRNRLYINTTKDNLDHKTTFKEAAAEYGLDNSERTRHAAFLDYNKDGLLDVFLLNHPPNPGNFSEMYGVDRTQERFAPRLYKNNGNKTFTDVTMDAGVFKLGNANSVSVFDANNDGWPDIYIAHDFGPPDAFFLNNTDGTFTNIIDTSLKHISYFSMGVDAADINNDGNLDLMVLDMVAEDNFRIKSNMSGMNPTSFWNIVNNGGHYQYMYNTLQLNQGVFSGIPQFSDIAQMAGVSSTDWSWSNVIADFDNDGLKDIYVTNGLLRDIRNTDSDKAVSNYVTAVANDFVKNNPNAGDVSIWDILDLEKTLNHIPSVRLSNYAFKNKDGMTFEKMSEEWGLSQKTFSAGCAYADLDNDGDLDLIVNNVNDRAFIYQNNGENKANQNYLRVNLTDKEKNTPMLGARVEALQGKTRQLYEFTSVRGMYSSSEQIAHFGFSENNKIDSLKITWPNMKTTVYTDVMPNQFLTIDLEDAHKLNSHTTSKKNPLFSTVQAIPFEHQENKFDDFDLQVLLPHKQSQFGPALAVGDVNGDGLEDVFVGGASGYEPTLFLQNKTGEFRKVDSETWREAAKYEDLDAIFFDMDNDGDLDLYVVSGGNEWEANTDYYQDRLYINEGKGIFNLAKSKLPSLTESGSVVRAFDYDKDGYLDLFIGGRHKPWDYPSPVSSRILKNNKGSFKDVTRSVAKDLLDIGMVTDAVWIDFDEDGNTDLVLTGEWMPITFIKNTGEKFINITHSQGLPNTEGWWYSLAAADMDNDGDLDLVAGNLGLNYKYKASEETPFEVHYSDFDKNGSKDIVLSYYNFGEQFPLRGRSCSAEQIPMIAKRFQSYDVFATANLTEVYGEDNLQSATHYSSKTFASAYFENKGKGKFSMKALPNEAQISNVDAILLEDFDGDGNKDILLAGNMYPVEIETTRNDAGVGLFLKGDGKGGFTPVVPRESGVYLMGDVQKLKRINTSGNKLIISAVNNGVIGAIKINE